MYSMKDEEEIRTNFKKIANIQVHFKYSDAIALTKRGKSPFLLQHLCN